MSYAPPGGGKRAIPTNGVLEGPPDPAVLGSWGPVIPWPHIAITAASLPDGRVLTWSSTETDAFPADREFTHSAVFDPTALTFQTVDNNFHDMFCAGVSTLEDGRIVAVGRQSGRHAHEHVRPGHAHVAPLADMNFYRWYGTNVRSPSNEIFSTFANGSVSSERYDPASNTWTQTTGADMQDLLNEQNAENGQTEVNTRVRPAVVGPHGRDARRTRVPRRAHPDLAHLRPARRAAACNRSGSPPARARACGATWSPTTRARCC